MLQKSHFVSVRLQKIERTRQRCSGLYPWLVVLKLDDANALPGDIIFATKQGIEVVALCVDL